MEITDEDRAEAERLALLPKQTQREAVRLIGLPAENPKVPASYREEARRRAKVLKSLLRLEAPKKK